MSHSSNLAPTKRKNDKAEVLHETVEHRPKDYDPACKCRTCQIVKKLLADCPCEDCRDDVQQLLDKQANQSVEGQVVVKSNENEVTHDDDGVEPRNLLNHLSPIHNDASTSERISENDQDDRSRSSTPDYAPRFFDDESESESGDSSSDDDDDEVGNEDKKLDQSCRDDDDELSRDPGNVLSPQISSNSDVNEMHQKMEQFPEKGTHDDVETLITDSTESLINNVSSEHNSTNDDDGHSRSSTPDYLPRFFDDESESGDSSSDDNEVDDGDKDDKELDEVSDQDSSYSKPNQRKSIKRSHDAKSSLQSNKHAITNDLEERFACPSCDQSFTVKKHVYRHYFSVHQQLESFYCKWAKCAFATSRRDGLIQHIIWKHFNRQKDSKESAQIYIGKRQILTPNNAPAIEVKSIFERKQNFQTECTLCRRIVHTSQSSKHARSHNKPGYRCNWPDCGFFYSNFDSARKHVCIDHLHVQFDAANSKHLKQYLVRVCPRTGKDQLQTNSVNQIEVQQSMAAGCCTSRIETNLTKLDANEDGESSSDDCETGS